MAYHGSQDYLGQIDQSQTKNYTEMTTAPKNVTSVDTAHEALMRARDLALRIEHVSERICGIAPIEAAKGAAQDPQPSGVLPLLSYNSQETLSYIRRANRALDRIDEHL